MKKQHVKPSMSPAEASRQSEAAVREKVIMEGKIRSAGCILELLENNLLSPEDPSTTAKGLQQRFSDESSRSMVSTSTLNFLRSVGIETNSSHQIQIWRIIDAEERIRKEYSSLLRRLSGVPDPDDQSEDPEQAQLLGEQTPRRRKEKANSAQPEPSMSGELHLEYTTSSDKLVLSSKEMPVSDDETVVCKLGTFQSDDEGGVRLIVEDASAVLDRVLDKLLQRRTGQLCEAVTEEEASSTFGEDIRQQPQEQVATGSEFRRRRVTRYSPPRLRRHERPR